MPTAAKLMAAISLAIVAMIVSELFKVQMPEGVNFGYFTIVNGIFAALVGWKTIGNNVGKGAVYAMNHALTGMLAMVVLILFLHSSWQMLQNATELRYNSVAEALRSVFEMMLEYGLLLLTPTIITILLGGALFTGLLAESTARRWR